MKRKHTTRKRKPARKKHSARVHRSKTTAAHYMTKAKELLLSDIGNLEAKKFAAATKRAKRKIAKQISEKKKKVRKLM